MQDGHPEQARDLDDAGVSEELRQILTQGASSGGLGCAQVDQQDAGSRGLAVWGCGFFGYAHGAALSPLAANLHSSVVTATMSMGLVQ